MRQLKQFSVKPLSMVTKEGMQRVDIAYHAARPLHLYLSVFRDENPVVEQTPVTLGSGTGSVSLLLPAQQESFPAV